MRKTSTLCREKKSQYKISKKQLPTNTLLMSNPASLFIPVPIGAKNAHRTRSIGDRNSFFFSKFDRVYVLFVKVSMPVICTLKALGVMHRQERCGFTTVVYNCNIDNTSKARDNKITSAYTISTAHSLARNCHV